MSETYYPDRWVLLEIFSEKSNYKKVLTSWYGGYLDSDHWKLSSSVEKIIEKDASYEFITESGSKYSCSKNHYGLTSLSKSIFDTLSFKAKDNNISIKLFDKSDLCLI
mgnify:CR=1 FL=1